MGPAMKRLLAVLLLGLLGVGLFLIGRQLFWPDRLTPEIARNLDVDLSLQGINLSQGRDGRKLWSLNATGADYAEDNGSLTLEAPIVTYWGDGGNSTLEVRAPKGQVWQKQDRARMWNGVNATNGQYTLDGQELTYSGAVRTLYMNGTVILQGEGVAGHFDTLTYFLDTGNITARGNIQVTLN